MSYSQTFARGFSSVCYHVQHHVSVILAEKKEIFSLAKIFFLKRVGGFAIKAYLWFKHILDHIKENLPWKEGWSTSLIRYIAKLTLRGSKLLSNMY